MRVMSSILTKVSLSWQGSQDDSRRREGGNSPSSPKLSLSFPSFKTFNRRHSQEPPESSNQPTSGPQQQGGEENKTNKFVIAVLGPSGAGKSSFIAHATGQNVEIGHLLTACTQSIDTYEKQLPDGRVLVFVDTPGYDLADKNPNQVLNMLTRWLKSQNTGGNKLGINVILFFHRINDNRMPIATQSHIKRFEKLVGQKGKSAQKRVLLITTMWDELDSSVGAFRQQQLETDFWKKLMEGGSSVSRFKRSHSSAWEILNPLLGVESEGTALPTIFDSVFQEEPEEEAELDPDQTLSAMEQIYLDQQRLLERLQAAIFDQSTTGHADLLKDVLAEETKVSGKLGTLLGRLRRQKRRWSRFTNPQRESA